MRLSVVIPSRNRYENLRQVLSALFLQTLSKDEFEVIVSNDNSTDGTGEIVFNYRDNLRLKYIFSNVPKPHTWNASIPRNLGASISDPSTTHLLFVDSDVVLPDFVLKNLVEDIERNPNRVIIGPYDFYAEGNEQIRTPDVRNLNFEVGIDETFDKPTDGLACFGGNLLIPKDLFWKVGGFSPDIHIGLEDGDMGLKLWKVGAMFSYDGRNRGKHLFHPTPTDRFPSDMKNHIDNLNLKHFHDKNPDYGIVEISREAYDKWGIGGWDPPPEWGKGKMDFMLKINK